MNLRLKLKNLTFKNQQPSTKKKKKKKSQTRQPQYNLCACFVKGNVDHLEKT